VKLQILYIKKLQAGFTADWSAVGGVNLELVKMSIFV